MWVCVYSFFSACGHINDIISIYWTTGGSYIQRAAKRAMNNGKCWCWFGFGLLVHHSFDRFKSFDWKSDLLETMHLNWFGTIDKATTFDTNFAFDWNAQLTDCHSTIVYNIWNSEFRLMCSTTPTSRLVWLSVGRYFSAWQLISHSNQNVIKYSLFFSLSPSTDIPADDILELFGKTFFEFCQDSGYDKILQVLGATPRDFLQVKYLH